MANKASTAPATLSPGKQPGMPFVSLQLLQWLLLLLALLAGIADGAAWNLWTNCGASEGLVSLWHESPEAVQSQYIGSSFFIDCLAFGVAQTSGACPSGVAAAGASFPWDVNVSVVVQNVDSGAVVETHRVTPDVVGASTLCQAYYMNGTYLFSLVFAIAGMPAGCSVDVAYTMSAYSQRGAPLVSFPAPLLEYIDPAIVIYNTPTAYWFRAPVITRTEAIAVVPLSNAAHCEAASKTSTSNRVTYGVDAQGRPGFLRTVTYPVPNAYLLCYAASPSSPWVYLSISYVWVTNPAYFTITNVSHNTKLAVGSYYQFNFFGVAFDLREGADSAKFVSARSNCNRGNAAGGPPVASNLGPDDAFGNVTTATWNVSLSIPGTFLVCYKRSTGSWVSLPWLAEIVVKTSMWHENTFGPLNGTAAPTQVPSPAPPTVTFVSSAEPTTLKPADETSVQPSAAPSDDPATTAEPSTSDLTTIVPSDDPSATPDPLTMVPSDDPTATPDPSTAEPSGEPTTTSAEPSSEVPSDEPSAVAPSTAEPTTLRPTTMRPSDEPTTTADPSTAEPSTVEPSSAVPSTAAPLTLEPTTSQPTTMRPSDDPTTTADPSTAEPSGETTTTAEPSSPVPSAAPSTVEPTTSQPTTMRPSDDPATTDVPSTAEPSDEPTTTAAPMTAVPSRKPTASPRPSAFVTSRAPFTLEPTAAPTAAEPGSGSGGPCPSPPTCSETLGVVQATNDPRLVVTFSRSVFPKDFPEAVEALLCLKPGSMQVYEFKALGDSQGQAVVGISCDLCVSAYEISFLQCFIDGPDAAQQDGTASSVEEGYAMPLILRKMGVTGSRVVSSTISTSNTTHHAAPSDDVLTTTQIAVISSGGIVLIVAAVVLVSAGLSYWKRKEISSAISRFTVAFVHPRELFSDPSVRPNHSDDVEDIVDEYGNVTAINEPTSPSYPRYPRSAELEDFSPTKGGGGGKAASGDGFFAARKKEPLTGAAATPSPERHLLASAARPTPPTAFDPFAPELREPGAAPSGAAAAYSPVRFDASRAYGDDDGGLWDPVDKGGSSGQVKK